MENQKKIQQWSLPEHTITSKQNNAQAYSKVSLSSPQKKALEEMVRKEKEKGYLEGKKEALQELLPFKNTLQQLMQQIQQNVQQQSQMIENQSVSIIEQICQSVIKRSLENDKTIIKDILQEAIKIYHDSTLKLNIKANRNTLARLHETQMFTDNVKLIEDNTLADFQFKLDANNQIVEFDINKAISKHFL